MNALIIPEDCCKDQYILKPLIKKMFAAVGKPQANVKMCSDPIFNGINSATNWKKLKSIIEMHRFVHVFLLLVDRDGVATRRQRLNQLERKANELIGDGRVFFAENAWQEIEVWALAGQQAFPPKSTWRQIREEPHPKEKYFDPLAEARGLLDEPGGGRSTMGREAASNYRRVIGRCQEDLAVLEQRLSNWLR